jgi:hypothetical protein
MQAVDLSLWKERLRPAVYDAVAAHARMMNREAHDTSEKHRVFRGQDLVVLIQHHPKIPDGYEADPQPEELV